MFLKDIDNCFWPVARVLRISTETSLPDRPHLIVHLVELDTGQKIYAFGADIKGILGTARKTFSALPGTYRVVFEGNAQKNDQTMLIPIVGWEVDENGTAQPICTVEYKEDPVGGVMLSDGKITDAFGGVFDNLERFVDYYQSDEMG